MLQRLILWVTALGFLLCTALSACADEFSWSGAYVGAQAAGVLTATHWQSIDLTREPVEFGDISFAGGGQAGVQYRCDNVVFGAEVSYTAMNSTASKSSALFPTVTYSSKLDDLLLAAGRLGWANERWLLYLKGGFAFGRFLDVGNAPNTQLGPDSFSGQTSSTGYAFGAGFERAVGEHLTLGIEYLNASLGPTNLSGRTTSGIAYTITDASSELNMVMGRLTWKFNY